METTGHPTGPYPGGLKQPAVNIRLAHGNPIHLANTLVVPVAEKRDVLGLEAPRLATVQQHRTRTRTNTNPYDTKTNAAG